MNLALVVTCWLAAAAAAWTWSPGSFRGARVWSKNKRNLASFKNKFGYRGETRDKRGMMKHPVMFARDSRFLIFLGYVCVLSFNIAALRMPSFHPHLRGSTVLHHNVREKRSAARPAEAEWRLEDCMTVSSKEEGVWTYTSDGRPETCGLYLVTIPDMVVELEILDMNVDCDSGLVVVRKER